MSGIYPTSEGLYASTKIDNNLFKDLVIGTFEFSMLIKIMRERTKLFTFKVHIPL
jgi:hypothetical protein